MCSITYLLDWSISKLFTGHPACRVAFSVPLTTRYLMTPGITVLSFKKFSQTY